MAVAGLAALGVVFMVLVVFSDDGPAPARNPIPAIREAVPVGLRATDAPEGVKLDWEGDESRQYVVLVFSQSQPPRPLPGARPGTSAIVGTDQLADGRGYCFSVAYLDQVVQRPEDPSAFSDPVCIRGATGASVIRG